MGEKTTETDVQRAISDAESAVRKVADIALKLAVRADDDATVSELVHRIIRRAHYEALKQVLATLDGWIEGAKENHDARAHRGELDPCWEQFHAVDIRTMVDHAARALGARELWRPEAS